MEVVGLQRLCGDAESLSRVFKWKRTVIGSVNGPVRSSIETARV